MPDQFILRAFNKVVEARNTRPQPEKREWLRTLSNFARRLFAHRHGRLLIQIRPEYRHLEIVGALVVLVVNEQNADEFVAHVNLGGIRLLRPRYDAKARIAEQMAHIRCDIFGVNGDRG